MATKTLIDDLDFDNLEKVTNVLFSNQRKMINKNLSNSDLAYLASNIEINKLKKPIGRQDHFIASNGNISCFKFHHLYNYNYSRE